MTSAESSSVLTVLILLCLARLPQCDASIVSVSADRAFLEAIQAHLSSTRAQQRLLGMLVAEIVSKRALDPNGSLKPLDFGDEIWAGDDPTRVEVRTLRALVDEPADADVEDWAELAMASKARQVAPPVSAPVRQDVPRPQATDGQPKPKIAVLSSSTPDEDDGFVAYALPDEESDSDNGDEPAEAAMRPPGSRRLRAPVYIADLAAYLRTDNKDANLAAERIAVALKSGEALIRRKAGWGRELCALQQLQACTS